MKHTVLITGASSGIGLQTAKLFQQKGWNVIATLRNPDQAPPELRSNGILLSRLDVTDPKSIKQSIENGVAHFGDIDVLINNAGYGIVGAFEPTEPERIRKQFETNVFGLMAVVQGILPHFRAKESGVIVNISSVGGRATFPLYSIYHATKFAVEGFSESLQFELEPLGIRVKLVEPGAVHTDFGGRSADPTDVSRWPDYETYQREMLVKIKNGAKQGQTPDQVARVIYQAATDGSHRLRYVSGSMAKLLLGFRRILPECLYRLFMRANIAAL